MNLTDKSAFPATVDDQLLADLVAEITDRLNSGQPVEIADYTARCPGHEERLRSLIAALCLVKSGGGSNPGAVRATHVPEALGDFRIIREVGRGGMGVVYEAEQLSLGRRVALKVLPFAATMDPKHLQRFHNEARAAASLHHTNIVPVFGVGTERGVHFYAMQFIDGRPLTDILRERRGELAPPSTPTDPTGPFIADTAPMAHATTTPLRSDSTWHRQVAEWGIQAAEALEYAHSMGIVHRDIKPGNLLLQGEPGASATGGRVWVTDFGLAKYGDASMTMSGDLLGTLRYMSPEQAMARHGLVDHRTDVYSLGATLYELLTGHPAVTGDDRQEILKQIAFEDPVAPRKLDARLPRDLETVVLKALEKNPGERYATAKELADDLRRWVEDKPLNARRPSFAQRGRRWARRHPRAAVTLALLAVVTLVGVWVWNSDRARRQAAAAESLEAAAGLKAKERYREALPFANRARDTLPRFGADSALRRQTREMCEDLVLLMRVEEIRLERRGFGIVDTTSQWVKRGFEQAFADYGVDVLGGDEAAVIQYLSRRQIRCELANTLEHWARITLDPDQRERLDRMAEAVDQDTSPFTQRMRRARFEPIDKEMLLKLAREAEAELPPLLVVEHLASYLTHISALPEAERLLRAGQMRNPGDLWMNFKLAWLLDVLMKRPAEALPFYTAALAVRPRDASLYVNLAAALQELKRHEEAADACRRAIEIAPNHWGAHRNLGLALWKLGRLDDAAGALQKAVETNPSGIVTYENLASVRLSQRRWSDAVAAAQDAVRRNPNVGEAHHLLGAILGSAGVSRFDEAEKALRAGIRLKGDVPEPLLNLARLLRKRGEFAEALTYFRRGHELGSQKPNWRLPSAEWLLECEKMVATERKLDAALAGTVHPSGAAEKVALGEMCRLHRKLPAAAVRFYLSAFTDDPNLPDRQIGLRYNAACAAALAAAGRGNDAPLADGERTRLRNVAHEWLRVDLAAWAKVADRADSRQKAGEFLHLWQNDTDLAGVRDATELAKLPESERIAWQKLWADVNDFLKRSEEPTAKERSPTK